MAKIRCESCEIIRQIASEYSDPSIVCPGCRSGWTAAAESLADCGMPMSNMARRRDDDDERPKPGKGKSGGGAGMSMGLILGIVGVLVVCCLCTPIGVGVGVMFMGVGKVRDSAARTQSTNNLKNISLGIQAFHDANKRLPFNGSNQPLDAVKDSATAIANNSNSGSWAFQILPYVEHMPLYNNPTKTTGVVYYLCPGRGRPQIEAGGGAWTDYFLNGYVNDPDQASKPDAADKRRTLLSITDGTSNTVMVGHGNVSTADYKKDANVAGSSNILVGGTIGTMRSGNNGAKSPGGVTLSQDSDKAPGIGSWGGPFPQGALMGMCDATVRMFPYTTANFGNFLTPSGQEQVMLPLD